MAKQGEGLISPLDPYLEELWDRKGSDLILTAGAPPLIRVDGVLFPLDKPSLTGKDVETVISKVLSADLFTKYLQSKEIDFSFNWMGKARFRANAFFQRGSCALALRLIPFAIPTLGDLGLPPIAETFANLPSGLVLFTGPTGSGKSTTQAAMIDYINEHRACHVITIEDPIEYIHRHKKGVVNQREIGEDTDSFERALRSALREDPDVLLVGEMRDLETMSIALTIAETGHLVFGTLHTNDAAQALDRIVDVFPVNQQQQIRVQLANSLAGIMYQRLVPRVEGGRVAAFEILVANHGIRNLIKEGKTRQIRNSVATGQKEGMQTLEMGLSDLVSKGVISYDDAVARSLFPGEITKPVVAPTQPEKKGKLRRR